MSRMPFVVLLIISAYGIASAEDNARDKPVAELPLIDAKGPIMSFYFAASRKEIEEKSGYGHSDNYPLRLTDDDAFGAKDIFSLVPAPDEPIRHFRFRGMTLRLVNRTTKRVTLAARDSHLHMTQEARDQQGTWRVLELPPRGTGPRDCAVGFHHVYLDPGEYWMISAPQFTGIFRTKLRFRLDLGKIDDKFPQAGGKIIYSPEFDGAVNPEQLVPAPAKK